MPAGVLSDPQHVALWLALKDVAAAGLRKVQRWTPADGLPPGAAGGPHQHAVPTLIAGLLGTTRVLGRATLDLAPGEALVIEPGCWHQHAAHRRGSASFGLGVLAGRCDVLFIDHRETLWGLAPEQPLRARLEALVDAPPAELPELVGSCLAQALEDRSELVDWRDPEQLRMAAWLWNNLHRPIRGGDVLAVAQLGRSKASALFSAFFGHGPKQELMDARLAIARHLLKRGWTVTAAAQRCGFSDRADLTRAHRRRFGVPPTGEG
jgi:AraC-like DNA-binding protein